MRAEDEEGLLAVLAVPPKLRCSNKTIIHLYSGKREAEFF
jgi:hypothetical protein